MQTTKEDTQNKQQNEVSGPTSKIYAQKGTETQGMRVEGTHICWWYSSWTKR